MNWKIYRAEEGNGFVSQRIWFDCLVLCDVIYGQCRHQKKQILLPYHIYELERYKGW